MTKLTVFDVDGTILDSLGFFEQIVNEYSDANGLPRPCMTTIQRGYGDPHNHDFKWGVERPVQVRHLYKVWELADARAVTGEPPRFYNGVIDALTHLKDTGHRIALVTSKPAAPLQYVIDHYKLGSMFCAIRNLDDVKLRGEAEKPAPDMLHSVMHDLKFHPDDTFMIGDTTMDVRMGLAAKTKTIGVTWGAHPREHLIGAGAHHIVETDIHDVVKTIKGLS
jgi:phosphoglycolate phosphatase